MKAFSIGRITLSVIILITALFVGGLVSDAVKYSDATRDIKDGNYTSASGILVSLDGYRDSEILKVYCDIMSEYDAEDFVSIYHCYRGLESIEGKLVNRRLAEEFARTTTEVETLYKHYNVSLSIK